MINVIALVETLGLQCTFAGLPFWMIDTSSEGGRRVQKFLFAGLDAPIFQDMGRDDGPICVSGLMYGGDFTAQNAAMYEAMVGRPGPHTLVHPVWGELQVVVRGRPRFSIRQEELSVVRFTAQFERFTPPSPAESDTLVALLAAIESVQAQAAIMLANLLSPVALALSVVSSVENFAGQAATIFVGLAQAAVAAPISLYQGLASDIAGDRQYVNALGPVVAAPAAALAATNTLTPGSAAYGAAVAASLQAVPSAIAAASAPAANAPVATSAALARAAVVDGRITSDLLLAASTQLAAFASQTAPMPTLSLAGQVACLSAAASCVSSIAFTSRQEATAWGQQIDLALRAAGVLAASVASNDPIGIGALWLAIADLRRQFAADMTSTIGRLPSVSTLILPVPTTAWAVAQYLAGDTPGAMLATFLDLVQRNDITNPGVVSAGPIEVLT